MFGEVSVTRLAYRQQRGEQNRYVADGVLNLPEEQASHGVRRLAAIYSAAGSSEHGTRQVHDRTGLGLGTRQVEELAVRAAADCEGFYAERAVSATWRGSKTQEKLSRDMKTILAPRHCHSHVQWTLSTTRIRLVLGGSLPLWSVVMPHSPCGKRR
ncbi:MAG: hypothetical protein M0T77_00020 [Actinomycetota bacterium]|nr:hypothetical protein [Actinomycetota bacterium]